MIILIFILASVSLFLVLRKKCPSCAPGAPGALTPAQAELAQAVPRVRPSVNEIGQKLEMSERKYHPSPDQKSKYFDPSARYPKDSFRIYPKKDIIIPHITLSQKDQAAKDEYTPSDYKSAKGVNDKFTDDLYAKGIEKCKEAYKYLLNLAYTTAEKIYNNTGQQIKLNLILKGGGTLYVYISQLGEEVEKKKAFQNQYGTYADFQNEFKNFKAPPSDIDFTTQIIIEDKYEVKNVGNIMSYLFGILNKYTEEMNTLLSPGNILETWANETTNKWNNVQLLQGSQMIGRKDELAKYKEIVNIFKTLQMKTKLKVGEKWLNGKLPPPSQKILDNWFYNLGIFDIVEDEKIEKMKLTNLSLLELQALCIKYKVSMSGRTTKSQFINGLIATRDIIRDYIDEIKKYTTNYDLKIKPIKGSNVLILPGIADANRVCLFKEQNNEHIISTKYTSPTSVVQDDAGHVIAIQLCRFTIYVDVESRNESTGVKFKYHVFDFSFDGASSYSVNNLRQLIVPGDQRPVCTDLFTAPVPATTFPCNSLNMTAYINGDLRAMVICQNLVSARGPKLLDKRLGRYIFYNYLNETLGDIDTTNPQYFKVYTRGRDKILDDYKTLLTYVQNPSARTALGRPSRDFKIHAIYVHPTGGQFNTLAGRDLWFFIIRNRLQLANVNAAVPITSVTKDDYANYFKAYDNAANTANCLAVIANMDILDYGKMEQKDLNEVIDRVQKELQTIINLRKSNVLENTFQIDNSQPHSFVSNLKMTNDPQTGQPWLPFPIEYNLNGPPPANDKTYYYSDYLCKDPQ